MLSTIKKEREREKEYPIHLIPIHRIEFQKSFVLDSCLFYLFLKNTSLEGPLRVNKCIKF